MLDEADEVIKQLARVIRGVRRSGSCDRDGGVTVRLDAEVTAQIVRMDDARDKQPEERTCRSCCFRANLWTNPSGWPLVRCTALPEEAKRPSVEPCSLYKFNGYGDTPDTPTEGVQR